MVSPWLTQMPNHHVPLPFAELEGGGRITPALFTNLGWSPSEPGGSFYISLQCESSIVIFPHMTSKYVSVIVCNHFSYKLFVNLGLYPTWLIEYGVNLPIVMISKVVPVPMINSQEDHKTSALRILRPVSPARKLWAWWLSWSSQKNAFMAMTHDVDTPGESNIAIEIAYLLKCEISRCHVCLSDLQWSGCGEHADSNASNLFVELSQKKAQKKTTCDNYLAPLLCSTICEPKWSLFCDWKG